MVTAHAASEEGQQDLMAEGTVCEDQNEPLSSQEGGFPADCQGKVACLVKDGMRVWLWMCPPEAEPLYSLLLLWF